MRLFLKYRGAHPIARLRSSVVPPRPPKLCSCRLQGFLPQTNLTRSSKVGFSWFLSAPICCSLHITPPQPVELDFPNFKQKGREQLIEVVEALAGLHVWISVGAQLLSEKGPLPGWEAELWRHEPGGRLVECEAFLKQKAPRPLGGLP